MEWVQNNELPEGYGPYAFTPVNSEHLEVDEDDRELVRVER